MSRVFAVLWSDRQPLRLACALDEGDFVWRECSCSGEATVEEQAEEIASQLQELEHVKEPVALLVDGSSCFAASMSIAGDTARDRATLRYRLEEFVPLEVEKLVVDFVYFEDCVFACAAEVTKLRSLVERLEDRGIRIASLAPFFVRGVEGLRLAKGEEESVDVVAWKSGVGIETIWLKDAMPYAWRVSSSDLKSWRAILQAMATDGRIRVRLFGFAPADLQELKSDGGIEYEVAVDSIDRGVKVACARAHRGDGDGWIDWRRDLFEDGRGIRSWDRTLSELAVAVVLFFLLLGAGAWVRTQRYIGARAGAELQKESIYRQVFPGERVPRGIERTLRQELLQLDDAKAGESGLKLERSALNTLRDILDRLPGDIRFKIDHIRVEGTRFELRGQVQEVGVAGRMAAQLRELGYGTTVPNDGRSFTIVGELVQGDGGGGEANR